MKKKFNSIRRTYWFKASVAFLTCLLFLFVPSCQKDQLQPDSNLYPENKVAPPSLSGSSSQRYWEQSFNWGGSGPFYGESYIGTPWFENFGNFVLKVQNVNASKISKLEVSIDGVIIITAKGLARDYFASKSLRSLVNNALLVVRAEGDQGCSINVWIEGTVSLGKAYGKHFYYITRQWRNWDETNGFCNSHSGHLVIINDARENDFLMNLSANTNRGFFIGLTDLNHGQQVWYWIDNTPCRTVNWNFNRCGIPNSECPDPVNTPIPWNNSWCTVITDYGFNNWNDGEPNNGGGGCNEEQILYHRDENVAVVDWNGKWSDIATVPGQGCSNCGYDDARRNCAVEWNFIPTSQEIFNIFKEEYPGYPW
jgi:hypothetical protein